MLKGGVRALDIEGDKYPPTSMWGFGGAPEETLTTSLLPQVKNRIHFHALQLINMIILKCG